MRVGILLSDLDPTVGGGYTLQEEVFEAFLNLADQSSHSFAVFCRPQVATRLLRRPLPDIEVIILDTETPAGPARLFGRIKRLWPPRSLGKQVKAAGIDFMWLLSSPEGQIPETPYLTIVWDLQHRLQPWFPEVSAAGDWQQRENIYASVLRRATAVIVGNQTGCAEVERFYQIDRSRILIVPHPTPRFAMAGTQNGERVSVRYGLSGDYLFYPAQFWAHKNHANLLFALDLLLKQFKRQFSVAFVGSDRGNLPHVKAVVERLGLQNHVRFLGFVPQGDLVGLYREAFALSYVSFFGPENLPPLEAFALGCPVIASDVAGAREQLENAALLVNPASPEGIAQAVIRLQDEKELKPKLIEAGQKIALERTPQGFVTEVLAFLDRFESVRRCWA
jgi:glycosyltransferase involved in cell wall biosynthesis